MLACACLFVHVVGKIMVPPQSKKSTSHRSLGAPFGIILPLATTAIETSHTLVTLNCGVSPWTKERVESLLDASNISTNMLPDLRVVTLPTFTLRLCGDGKLYGSPMASPMWGPTTCRSTWATLPPILMTHRSNTSRV